MNTTEKNCVTSPMAVMIFSSCWDHRFDYLFQKKLFHWKMMKLIVLRLSHRYLKVTHSYWISISFLNLTFMEFFQYLGVRLSTLRLPKVLQQMTSHALIALLSQLRPESHSKTLNLSEAVPPAEESVVEGLIERSQGTQTRVPLHRSQSQFLFRMHTVIEPPGRQIGKNRYKSQQILPHLLSCSSSRPLKSPASNSCWVAQLLPRRAGTKQSLVDNHENQSLHSAVRKDIRAGKWIFASPQMYSILRVFFWPFLQSLLSSKGDFSDANDFIVIVEKAQEEFPLQTSRT